MLNYNKKRIVYFGCSFTSGLELIDHELLGITAEQSDNLKKQWISDGKTIVDFMDYLQKKSKLSHEEIIFQSAKRSYASKLSAKLELEHVNYARPGCSVDHSLLMLFSEYYAGYINPETDIIFLGITTPHRYLTFQPNKLGKDHSRVMGHSFEEADMHYNDYKVLQTFLFALHNFKNFCETKKFQVFIQPMVESKFLFYNEEDNVFAGISPNWPWMNLFKTLFHEILEYSIDPELDLFSGCGCVTGQHGFKHPNEFAHQIFSEKLYDKIINSNN